MVTKRCKQVRTGPSIHSLRRLHALIYIGLGVVAFLISCSDSGDARRRAHYSKYEVSTVEIERQFYAFEYIQSNGELVSIVISEAKGLEGPTIRIEENHLSLTLAEQKYLLPLETIVYVDLDRNRVHVFPDKWPEGDVRELGERIPALDAYLKSFVIEEINCR